MTLSLTPFLKAKKRKILRPGQSGQGVVEYVLLLFIVLVVIFGAVAAFNKNFTAWAQNYFGNYLACLLETGELPSLGGPTDNGSICAEEFQPFTIAQGRPPVGGSTRIPGAPPGSGSGSGSGGKTARKETSDGPVSRGADGPRSAGGGGSSGTTGKFNSLLSKNRDGAPSSVPLSKADSPSGNAAGVVDRAGSYVTNLKDSDLNGRRVPLSKNETLENGKTERNIPVDIDTKDIGKKRFAPGDKKKERAVASTDEEFTFGDFFRLLLIIGILIALLVFFGGQAAQFSKSQEKG